MSIQELKDNLQDMVSEYVENHLGKSNKEQATLKTGIEFLTKSIEVIEAKDYYVCNDNSKTAKIHFVRKGKNII